MEPPEKDLPYLEKVEPVRIFEQAVAQLRELILTGQVLPGERLPAEKILREKLNVGRSTVREALRILEAEGLVEVRRGKGTFVVEKPFFIQPRAEVMRWLESQLEAIEEVLQVRDCIEPRAASLAAEKQDLMRIAEIRKIVAEQNELLKAFRDGVDLNFDRLALLDSAFHIAIAHASGNHLFLEVLSHILPAFNQSNRAALYVTGRWENIESEHLKILQAIEAGDAAGAELAMRQHIQQVESAF